MITEKVSLDQIMKEAYKYRILIPAFIYEIAGNCDYPSKWIE